MAYLFEVHLADRGDANIWWNCAALFSTERVKLGLVARPKDDLANMTCSSGCNSRDHDVGDSRSHYY